MGMQRLWRMRAGLEMQVRTRLVQARLSTMASGTRNSRSQSRSRIAEAMDCKAATAKGIKVYDRLIKGLPVSSIAEAQAAAASSQSSSTTAATQDCTCDLASCLVCAPAPDKPQSAGASPPTETLTSTSATATEWKEDPIDPVSGHSLSTLRREVGAIQKMLADHKKTAETA